MVGMLFIAGITGLLILLGLIESRSHYRHLTRIPIRIHVNGTRGKSGVTRLIAAGLRAGGIRTFAKTTGTLAQMILPDGREQPVIRIGRTNVIEQVSVVRAAARCQAEAIVMECMALQPALQSLCELKLLRSTHSVVTNARPDHLDVMGPTAEHVARALAGTAPVGGRLYTAEQALLHVLEDAAADRGSQVRATTPDDIAEVTADEMQGFAYIEHPENVALALSVSADLGIDRATALAGMWAACPDAGVMTKHEVAVADRQVVFVNGFAANDPQSSEIIWHLAAEHVPQAEQRIAVFNCRADREDRSRQLADMVAKWDTASHIVLIGTGTDIFLKRALAAGVARSQITQAGGWSAKEIAEQIVAMVDRSAMVMGIGNIGGVGMQLVDFFHHENFDLRPVHESETAIKSPGDRADAVRPVLQTA